MLEVIIAVELAFLALKHGREVAEGEKIRVYLNQINETFRKKRK